MKVRSFDIEVRTEGENSFSDLTMRICSVIREGGISNGTANIFVLSTTSSLIICENEDGLIGDITEAAARIAPDSIRYRHNLAWNDGNGRSHVKATLHRQDLTVPVRDGELHLGTWQSIFLVEFDVRPRNRRVSITVMGE